MLINGVECSTPFGITDYIGGRVIGWGHERESDVCSTPFGITDYIGRGAAVRPPRRGPAVLNAFRHHGLYRWSRQAQEGQDQRCSTPFGITDYIGCGRWCGLLVWLVLNAFRHHGLYRRHAAIQHHCAVVCSTPFGITDYIGPVTAARHPQHLLRQCSTPFGITDYIGCGSTRRRSAGPSVQCSTPFGITDYIGASVSGSTPATWPCAQRLSASRIISDEHGDRAGVPPLGAQRLSASRIISAQQTLAGPSARPCSTPFGITDYIGRPAGHPEHQIFVLNAFRHHGLYR